MENQDPLAEEMRAAAKAISRQLNERGKGAYIQILNLLRNCGIELIQTLVNETLEIEAQGGMMLPNNSRRRTPGGVFFLLARTRIDPEISRRLFARNNAKARKARKARLKKQKEQQALAQTEAQAEKSEAAPAPVMEAPPKEAAAPKPPKKVVVINNGEIISVKVTLIGRPDKIETRQDLVVTRMTHTQKAISLPKGVPPLPTTPTVYTVYIGSKQWQKVKQAIKDPEDALIIEGTCAFDPELNGMAVYTTNITTRLLEAQRREAQKPSVEAAGDQPPQEQKAAKAEAPTKKAPKAEPPIQPPSAIPVVTPTIPAGMPPEEAQKLTGLYASAALFRQKIGAILAKPPEQQSGLEMTQKLLKGVEDQIAALEKKYT